MLRCLQAECALLRIDHTSMKHLHIMLIDAHFMAGAPVLRCVPGVDVSLLVGSGLPLLLVVWYPRYQMRCSALLAREILRTNRRDGELTAQR